MSKDEFMKRVEYLLSDLPEEETRDALDYYRDYLEEAGEAAEETMREFGSPERIASIIRSDLQGNLADGGEFTDAGYTDERFREPNFQLARREQDSRRKPEAGQGAYTDGARNPGEPESRNRHHGDGMYTKAARESDTMQGVYTDASRNSDPGQGAYAYGPGETPQSEERTYRQEGQHRNADGYGNGPGAGSGADGRPGSPGRGGSNQGMKVLWIILAVIGVTTLLPALLGFAGSAFGILAAAAAVLLVMLFLTAILTLVFLVAGVAVIAAGIAAAFVNPIDGMMCVGAGLVLLALGLIGIVLSVLVYGKLLPWIFGGIADGLGGLLHRRRRAV